MFFISCFWSIWRRNWNPSYNGLIFFRKPVLKIIPIMLGKCSLLSVTQSTPSHPTSPLQIPFFTHPTEKRLDFWLWKRRLLSYWVAHWRTGLQWRTLLGVRNSACVPRFVFFYMRFYVAALVYVSIYPYISGSPDDLGNFKWSGNEVMANSNTSSGLPKSSFALCVVNFATGRINPAYEIVLQANSSIEDKYRANFSMVEI